MLTLDQVDLQGRRVVIRVDFNVPLEDGRVTSGARLEAALPTIRHVIESGAAVMLMSHLGRPDEGAFDEAFSLAPVAAELGRLLDRPVALRRDWIDGVDVGPGEVVLLENVRFLTGEKANDPTLARRMASLADVVVFDAFATAHRSQASTEGLVRHAATACAGRLMARELASLEKALAAPRRPMVAVVGGAKVSTKLTVLEALIEKVDRLIVGGGIANTFLAAAGHRIGTSLHEPDLVETAARLLERARERGADIPLPVDVRTAADFSPQAVARVVPVDEVDAGEMILDVGPETGRMLADIVRTAGTVLWNGPLGVFEFDAFGGGTRALALAVAESPGFTLAGGGDTIAAIEKYGVAEKIDYISTAGGAFLEYVEGRPLPVVEALKAASGRV